MGLRNRRMRLLLPRGGGVGGAQKAGSCGYCNQRGWWRLGHAAREAGCLTRRQEAAVSDFWSRLIFV
eukprot:3030680-Prymnesium_polylepis.1